MIKFSFLLVFFLRLLLGQHLLRAVMLDVLEHARIGEETVHAVGRCRALGKPHLGLLVVGPPPFHATSGSHHLVPVVV